MERVAYSASGKLLLFGEYLVLRGSRSLSIPLSVGQKLDIRPGNGPGIRWCCYEFGKPWLEIYFSRELEVIRTTNAGQSRLVRELLLRIKELAPALQPAGHTFRFDLDFSRQYGFGTSATLISLLSQWSGVDPYRLLAGTFGGSGYDIAAATAAGPVLYAIDPGTIGYCRLPEEVTRHLLFVYTGKKQATAAEVAAFKNKSSSEEDIKTMNAIVNAAAACREIADWEKLMRESEKLLSSLLNIPPVGEKYFADYPFAVKSLGAWGGDFIMATCRDVPAAKRYFQQKGKQTVFTYNDLIKGK